MALLFDAVYVYILLPIAPCVFYGKKLVKNSETFSGQTAGEADYGGRTRDIELGRLAFYH